MTEQTPDRLALERVLESANDTLTPAVRAILVKTCTMPGLSRTIILGGGIAWGKTTVAKHVALHRAMLAVQNPEAFPDRDGPLVIDVATPIAGPIAVELRGMLSKAGITEASVRVDAFERFDAWENKRRGFRFQNVLGVICEAPYWFGRSRELLDIPGSPKAPRFRVGCFNREVVAASPDLTTFAINLPMWGTKREGELSGRVKCYALIRDGRAELVSINAAVFVRRDPLGARLFPVPEEYADLFEGNLAQGLLDCYGIETVQ